MHKTDIKIFELIEMLKTLGRIQYDFEFCEQIGLLKQNIAPIKKGLTHFTTKHIENICKVYGVRADWIFGLENNVFQKIKSNQKSVQTIVINQN